MQKHCCAAYKISMKEDEEIKLIALTFGKMRSSQRAKIV